MNTPLLIFGSLFLFFCVIPAWAMHKYTMDYWTSLGVVCGISFIIMGLIAGVYFLLFIVDLIVGVF